MSQTKAQLVAPVGVVTASSMTVTGVLTATTLDGNVIGAAGSIAQGNNLNVGVVTASGIGGDITGSATSITQGNNVTFGSLTASRLVGDLEGNAVGNALGDALSATVTGITTTNNINVGVITATSFRGSASNLDGVGSSPVSQQAVTADGATTAIDLSSGNLIYMTQSASTTVSFANTSNGNVYIIRTKDDTSTARTITWPTGIGWSGGTAPTLIQDNPRSTDAQVFLLVTRNEGETWYGKEVVNIDPQTFSMFTWGGNFHGQLGGNDDEQSNMKSSPTQVGTNTNWKYGQFGFSRNGMGFASATKTDGTLWSWGYGSKGNLGHNDRNSRSSPTQIPGTTWNRSTGAGEMNMLSTKTDGTLWAWGSNSYSGPLGLNHRDDVSSPTQVPGTWGTSELSICGYNYYTAGVKADGTLWSWGNNGNGQLGQNIPNTTKRSSPTQVGTDTDWLKLQHSGSYSMGCIKTDGTLWVWGEGDTGQLGQDNTTRYSSPVQIPGSWSQTTGGCYKGFFGIKTNGTLWSCGNNGNGQMGQNDTVNRSSPRQVGTETTWSTVVGCDETCFATKTDGTAWSWGFNDKMALGHNQPVNTKLSSPTQISGTSWEIIYAVQNMGMGFQKAG
tara:strand:+ start:3933 stop:5777 length:1845 start_codon:yes stop_codon:yes gene_type:complete